MRGDQGLGRADGKTIFENLRGNRALFLRGAQTEKRFGMADTEAPLHEMALHFGVEIEQTHGVGHRGAALADFARDVFLLEFEFVGQPRVGLSFFDRIQIGALQVFHQRKLKHFEVGRLTDDDGNFFQSGLTRGAPATFARDELEETANLADNERLDDAVLADGIDQLGEQFGSEIGTRLQRAGHDPRERDALHAIARRFGCGNGGSGGF